MSLHTMLVVKGFRKYVLIKEHSYEQDHEVLSIWETHLWTLSKFQRCWPEDCWPEDFLNWSNALTKLSVLYLGHNGLIAVSSCWCKYKFIIFIFACTVEKHEPCSTGCIPAEGRLKNSSSRVQKGSWWSCSDWRDHSRWVQSFWTLWKAKQSYSNFFLPISVQPQCKHTKYKAYGTNHTKLLKLSIDSKYTICFPVPPTRYFYMTVYTMYTLCKYILHVSILKAELTVLKKVKLKIHSA